jgi:amylosucrase
MPSRSAGRSIARSGPATSSPRQLPDLERAIQIARATLTGLPQRDVDLFEVRLAHWWDELEPAWSATYAGHARGADALSQLIQLLAHRYRERPDPLKLLDLRRSLQPDWFQKPEMIGYVCYADRFAGSLRGVEAHLDYLAELEVRYLHLMPLLRTRPGETDGGYAVADYRQVEPALGTMDDLEHLCGSLRERGISLCIDLVLNHAAAEHPWARAAVAGDAAAAEMFYIYPDRTEPDRWERTLPCAFPETAPGNFTQLPDGRWVWTTFNSYQWDLNWTNPAVFLEMMDIVLDLAGRGVEVFRLDAVAFMWKRLGTNCQNQPEVFDLLQALRAATRIAAPAVVFKSEAIVAPSDLVRYLGVGRHYGRVSDLAYHNSLMVQFWSALATRDTRLATEVLGGLPRKPPTTAWATYIRCHDDIGWAVGDEAAEAVGWSGPAHREFLSEFYAGRFPGSFARGEVFQYEPATRDSRISGTFASLAGLEAAVDVDDPALITAAIERIRLGHALILAWDGIPLLYMGDELGLLNDWTYREDPGHALDNRWLHRPRMDWLAADRRHRRTTPEGRIWTDLRQLIEVRRATPQLHAATPLELLDADSNAMLMFQRDHPLGPLVSVSNVTDTKRTLAPNRLPATAAGPLVDLLDGSRHANGADIDIPARGVRWLIRSTMGS